MRARVASKRPSPWGFLRGLVIVLSWLGGSVTASALDPARPLATLAQHTWRSEDGLLQDTASALLESRDGFLWIGTGAGLVRFDGATFDHYSRLNLPGFEHNAVQGLAEGADGALWIGTSEPGLYRLVHGEIRVFGVAEGLPGHPILRLLRDRNGTLWAAPTEGPLLRFDGTRFQSVPSDAVHLRIRALATDADGTLWAGTAGSGLWRLREGRLVLAALTAADITAVETPKEGGILVGTRSQGLLTLSDGRLEPPAWARSLPRKAVSSLLLDREGSLWVGLEQGGLFRRNPEGRWEASPRGRAAPRTPLALLEDSSGALWSGSEERGLEVLFPVPFQAMPILGADPEEPARMVCQDTEGTVWCLTGNQSLGRVRDGRLERMRPANPGAPITSIWPRAAGGLWVGTQNGELHVLEQGRFRRFRPADGLSTDAILSLYEAPDQILWVATSRRGLLKLAPGAAPLLFPAVSGVLALAGGGPDPLYLASRTQGLGLLEEGQIRWLGRAEGLGSSGVLSLHLDRNGSLWIGTVDGLRRYGNGQFQTFGEGLGPLRLAIHAILEDTAHRLWLSTVQGVYQIPRDVLLNGLDQPGAMPAVVFDHHDGMPSRETAGGAQPAAWLVREGDLYFPTTRGLARLDGRAAAPQGPPLRLHFLKAESDETVLPDLRPIRVPAGTHRFEVYYTATSLTRADKVRFRYRLEGWERTWNDVGDRRFSAYSNLPPGSYRFVLQAWRLDEAGSAQEGAIDVIVQPFLYQRPVFWVLCGLVILAFGGWLHHLRLQQLEARSAVLSERNRMAREIHDHLAQGFTGVLLQLEAAEAKLARLQGDATPVLTRIEHARNLAVSSLQEARRSVMALRPRKPEGTDLLGAIRLLSDRLLAGTDIQVELAVTGQPRRLRERLEEELLRMAQELLTNALRHGKARWVRAVLQFEPHQVSLSVEDDGKGFDPSADVAGYGMRSIREGIKQLRGRLDIDTSQGLGSRITITLPTRRWRP
ncbi:histidine kinase [Geothrix limicola]|uniref:Histidine kinase n=1 Tax=Geothrix limicola TaxID=2927978 RepID=A0ABQ5QIW7_9BACT|nr:sensor histidine kinase [Geothrix limicola]GLH74506.1 histidine kinase [Geothrix limicola]